MSVRFYLAAVTFGVLGALFQSGPVFAQQPAPLSPIEFRAPEASDNIASDAEPQTTLPKTPTVSEEKPSTALQRRGLAAPFDSPPFPSSEWPIGGTSVIGAPNSSDPYPLMKALHHTDFGRFLEKNRINIYGWSELGGNISTSHHTNYPESYSVHPNRIDSDQLALNIERIPDTVQREHLDWGFRLTGFYGSDYRFTTAKGVFSNQLLKHNRQYGFDPLLFYGDLYIPKVAQGMNIRVGRFLSVPDIEAQLAPDNYMFTHSLMYTVDVFTQTGVLTSTRLNNQWTVQLGITAGNDVVPWTNHIDVKPTGLAGIQWISKRNKDSVYLVADTINDGKYAYNNVQEYVATWSHKFNDILHTKTEAWYMWQRDVPANTLSVSMPTLDFSRRFTNEYAAVNFLEIKLSPKTYLTIRNEFMNDLQGQRTGHATLYTGHGIGFAHWFTSWLGFRPEVRLEHAYDKPAYDNGRKSTQFMFAADLITRF